jgi:uncharacterized protein (DUF302 family)
MRVALNTLTTSESAMERSSTIRHTRLATGLSYDALVHAFERELGHLDPAVTRRLVGQKAAWSEVEREIGDIGRPHGLMIIARADQGAVISLSGRRTQCSLYLVGNPVIASRIISIDVRGSFYVPFRVALYDDGHPEGAVMAYDRPSSFLAALGHAELTEIGESLDRKIDTVASALRA